MTKTVGYRYHSLVIQLLKKGPPLDPDKSATSESNLGAMLAPGNLVRHPDCPEWGLGQVQSVDGDRVTVNFEHTGKQLIKTSVVGLILVSK